MRKLAALDMALHGPRLIVVEFALGVIVCAVLGALSFRIGVLSRGLSWQLLLGIWLLFVAVNYAALLIHALDLARRGNSRHEVADELGHPEILRRYTVLQLWLLVPIVFVTFAILQAAKRPA